MSDFARATAIARTAFEVFLDQSGTVVRWKQRRSVVPRTSGGASEYAGRGDPQDSDYSPADEDPNLWTDKGTIKVIFPLPSRVQAEAAGQMVSGEALGYCSIANEVSAGDLLLTETETWHVAGARVPNPPIYRELTLRR
jgi:hypothetical protein